MALGRYSRVDGKKSSGFCSSVTIVGFVALCLVGVWMMTSSSVVPVQNSDVSSGENQNEVNSKAQISDNNEDTGSTNDNNEDKRTSSDDTQQEQNPSNVNNENSQEGKAENKETEEKIGDSQVEKAENKDTEEKTGDSQVGKAENKETEEKMGDGGSSSELKGKDKKENVESKTDFEAGETKGGDTSGDSGSGEGSKENKSDADSTEKKSEERTSNNDKPDDQTEAKVDKISEQETQKTDKGGDQTEEKKSEEKTQNTDKGGDQTEEKKSEEKTQNNDKGDDRTEEKADNKINDNAKKENNNNTQAAATQPSNEVYPSVSQSELLNETTTQNGSFPTQAAESNTEKASQKSPGQETKSEANWKVCNTTAGPDYIPCLDNVQVINHLKTTKHYEHRERHCPENPPTCLVPLPEGYQRPIAWPASRDKIWYHNVPHAKLATIKARQNWVKVTGEFLTFPGGGTQFKHGALHYIDFIQESVPEIDWGKRTRVALDVGCGVASFGGFQFDRNVLTMSLAPKDEHEAQVQFALERGIPAISAVMGTKRLPYPARVFDVVHCARCRVPWHIEGGKLLLELNRMLRPGGFFVWSATPVYQKKIQEDVEIWEAMKKLTKSMCWEVVKITKDKVNKVGIAIYRKPSDNKCYDKRKLNDPPMCPEKDDPNAAWNVPLQACMHKIPVASSERGSKWPETWPARVEKVPYWLSSSQTGVYGKPAPEDFTADYNHWKRVVETSYLKGMAIDWSTVRNVMDMRAIYGGFAAALKDLNVWVMNIVTVDSPDTLPIIYERGLFGIYHDWCESFSTYPRSYDLLHADHLFSKTKKKCNLTASIVEVDRILRPEGKIIIRDDIDIITELQSMFKSMHWEIRMTYNKKDVGLLCAQKSIWRPQETETLAYAIGNIK